MAEDHIRPVGAPVNVAPQPDWVLGPIPRLDVDSSLLCPACGSSGMHYFRIRDYARHESTGYITITNLDGGGLTTQIAPSHTTDNPSSDESGVALGFICYDCGEESELTLASSDDDNCVRLAWRPLVRK
jgi:hypothetical protein